MELWDLYLGWPNSLKISTLSWSRISRNFKDCPWKILDYFNSSTLDLSLIFLENIKLELIWKLEDFQGVPLKNPWTFNLFNPWLVYDIPWKCLPWIELGIQGLPLKIPWIRKFFNPWLINDFPTLPWNSRIFKNCP